MYRNHELNDIVEYHRTEPERVTEFKEHLAKQEGGGGESDFVRLVEGDKGEEAA